MNARNRILHKLRQAPRVSVTQVPVQQTSQNPARADTLNQFIELLQAQHAEVHTVSPAQRQDKLRDLLHQNKFNHVMVGTDCESARLVQELIDDDKLHPFAQPFEQHKEALFEECDLGITGSHGGLIDCGAIVLWPDASEPRSLSLVPPTHLVLVNASQLYPDLTSMMTEQQWQRQMPSNLVLVSGPSKTSDIQQTQALGAHGPKRLIVLLVNDTI